MTRGAVPLRGSLITPESMPSATSWPTLVLAVIYCAALPFVPRLRLPKVDAAFLLTWVILGYIFYMMIAPQGSTLYSAYHLSFCACVSAGARRTLGRPSWRMVAPLALACSVFALTVATRPVPYVTGTRQAAQDVARLAPPDERCRLGKVRRHVHLRDARLYGPQRFGV